MANDPGGIVENVIQQLNAPDENASEPPQEAPNPPPATIPGIVPQGDNAALPAIAYPPATFENQKTVILRALDKVTARTQTLKIPVGEQFNFGALTIAVRACRARPPLESPDAAAFLQIVEQKPGEPMIARFSGWMFASKPSLSALEHPVYDVWVVGCGKPEEAPKPADNPMPVPSKKPASPTKKPTRL